jgi:hypothetical protein
MNYAGQVKEKEQLNEENADSRCFAVHRISRCRHRAN